MEARHQTQERPPRLPRGLREELREDVDLDAQELGVDLDVDLDAQELTAAFANARTEGNVRRVPPGERARTGCLQLSRRAVQLRSRAARAASSRASCFTRRALATRANRLLLLQHRRHWARSTCTSATMSCRPLASYVTSFTPDPFSSVSSAGGWPRPRCRTRPRQPAPAPRLGAARRPSSAERCAACVPLRWHAERRGRARPLRPPAVPDDAQLPQRRAELRDAACSSAACAAWRRVGGEDPPHTTRTRSWGTTSIQLGR